MNPGRDVVDEGEDGPGPVPPAVQLGCAADLPSRLVQPDSVAGLAGGALGPHVVALLPEGDGAGMLPHLVVDVPEAGLEPDWVV